MKQQDFFIIWSKLHGDAKVTGIVKAWLIISFALVKPLSKLKFTPNILTLFGLFFGVLLYINAQSPWAALLLVLSLTCDGIDGSLAILTSKFSKWGALLDSTADRITEVFWLLTLYKIGADIKLLLVIVVFASVQEYLRARAGGLGMSQVGVVTFAERPVRASFIFIALIASAIDIAIIPQIVILWLLLQVISFFMITRFVFLNLR
jgi:phosphatidylglycerophosphate synthase